MSNTNNDDDETSKKKKRPVNSAFRQQRLSAWQPILTPGTIILTLGLLGCFCCVTGGLMIAVAQEVVQAKVQYDGPGTDGRYADCAVRGFNEEKSCIVHVKMPKKMKAPVYIYYELSNLHQNHRRYSNSLNHEQLMGSKKERSELGSCAPLKLTDTATLNPCGLIANTLFNDIFTLIDPIDITMKESDISFAADRNTKFQQPDDFDYSVVNTVDSTAVEECLDASCDDTLCESYGLNSGCRGYQCTGGDFDQEKCDAGEFALYRYPSGNYQYLYQTFPRIISPLVGVENEHFIVWMNTAALPHFRKLYGRITHTLDKHQVLSFNVSASFYSHKFKGSKFIVASTTSSIGTGQNPFLGIAYLGLGSICLILSIAFATFQYLHPRHMGDESQANTALRHYRGGSSASSSSRQQQQ